MTDALPLLKATHASCSCPVCLDVFKDPVGFHCGHVLCRACALRCISARPCCPLCNQRVPNARHLVPLPQFSLFCVLTREVGLRARPPYHVKTDAKDNAFFSSDIHHFFGVARAADRGEVSLQPPSQQRRRTEASPPPAPQSLLDTPSHLPGVLLLSTAGGTQCLQSESPEQEQPPALKADFSSSPRITHSCSSLASTAHNQPQIKENGGDKKTDAPADLVATTATSGTAGSATTASTSPPLSPTLALQQASFAQDAGGLESTPRLNSPTREIEKEVNTNEGDNEQRRLQTGPPQLQKSCFTSASWWRLWRRNRGVVHCALVPPAVRLQAALREKQAETLTARNRSGGGSNSWGQAQKTAARSAAKRNARPEFSSAATKAGIDASFLLSASEETRLHRSGCCVLCGLDVVRRTTVRRRLRRLLHSSFARCDPQELAAQTEDGLSRLLGPLWGVLCSIIFEAHRNATTTPSSAEANMVSYTSTDASDSMEEWEGECDADASATTGRRRGNIKTLRAVAHHNCLAWAGFLDFYTDTSSTSSSNDEVAARLPVMQTTTAVLRLTVPLQDPFALLNAHTSGRVARWQLLAASLWHTAHSSQDDGKPERRGFREVEQEAVRGPHCVLCEASSVSIASPSAAVAADAGEVKDIFGVGLRTCEGTERGESSCGRQFHYPCALLAGAAACLAFGLEDERNVLVSAEDTCVRDAPDEVSKSGGQPVEVWCGPCHEHHESRRRSRHA